MKIISVFVSSLDGRITKGENIPTNSWSSKEDQVLFRKALRDNKLIVMGSGTFNPKYIKGEEGKLRVVLTGNPGRYKKYKVSERLEFSNENPQQLVSRLKKDGFTQMLLVAGAKVTTAFFKEHLVHELWITFEPGMFGKGKQILTEEMDVQLELLEIKKLNSKGTILLKYLVKS